MSSRTWWMITELRLRCPPTKWNDRHLDVVSGDLINRNQPGWELRAAFQMAPYSTPYIVHSF